MLTPATQAATTAPIQVCIPAVTPARIAATAIPAATQAGTIASTAADAPPATIIVTTAQHDSGGILAPIPATIVQTCTPATPAHTPAEGDYLNVRYRLPLEAFDPRTLWRRRPVQGCAVLEKPTVGEHLSNCDRDGGA